MKGAVAVLFNQRFIKSRKATTSNWANPRLTEAQLVYAATGEVVDSEALGGAQMHCSVSGVADHLAENDMHALALARQIVGSLNWKKDVPVALRDIGMKADDLDLACELALQNQYPNPRPLEKAAIRQLLQDAFEGNRPAS